MNHLRFAFRQLLKNPGFAAVAVVTLALGKLDPDTQVAATLNCLPFSILKLENLHSHEC